jgi:hypothetical protein
MNKWAKNRIAEHIWTGASFELMKFCLAERLRLEATMEQSWSGRGEKAKVLVKSHRRNEITSAHWVYRPYA